MSKKLKTHVAFCIDESGSVKGIIASLVEAYNKTVIDIRNAVLDEGQEASMTALSFGDRVLKHRVLYVGQQVQTVTPLKVSDLNPTGMTPLFDSVYRAIKKLEELDDKDETTSFITTVVTDGFENASNDPGVAATLKLIREKTGLDRWTFTFMVPNGGQARFSRDFDIPMGNIQEWDSLTAKGTEAGFAVSSKAYKSYFTARSAGVRSTESFYSDMSGATVRSVRSSLSEVTSQVEIFNSPSPGNIREVVERAKRPYIKGAAFYQLVKTEKKVQPYKLVVVRVKTSGKVYCGQEARSMLGIDVSNTVRVVPGDHGKFDVFIQSTSYNRNIPVGTDVLYWPTFGTQKK
jgi:hypothetical protein